MKAATRIRYADKPNIVHLSSPLNPGTVGEIYDAVRYKAGNTIVRAGKDSADHWYVYLPKKENKLAAATYKAASIQRHRQQMQDLLIESSHAFNNKDWVGVDQRKMILMLRQQVMQKDIAHADFSAREVATTLKPLSNQVRSRKRLEKTSALRASASPMLKSRKDYLKQFLHMSSSDLQIMSRALFPIEKTISFQENKHVLISMFTLIKDYLNQDGNGQTLADLVRRHPQKDLLLKFSKAWTDHVKTPHSGRYGNLLIVFSWQKTMTSICHTIMEVASQPSANTAEFTSPERSKVFQTMMRRSHGAMDGGEPESPTKFPSLPVTPIVSLAAIPIVVDTPDSERTSQQTVGKFELANDLIGQAQHFFNQPEVTALPTSVSSLPELDDADADTIHSQAISRTDEPQV